MPSAYSEELEFAITVANHASVEVRRLYEDRSAAAWVKDDESPVTDADLASDHIIRESIARQYPGDAILTEEGVDDESRLSAERVWIADPIDGTQQFVDRTGQFDILLALVVADRPVVSVAAQPATGIFLAAATGGGAFGGTVKSDVRFPVTLAQPGPSVSWGTTIWLGAPDTLPYLERAGERAGISSPLTTSIGVVSRQYLERDHPLLVRASNPLASPDGSPLHAFVGLPLRGDGTMAWEWDFITSDLIVHEAGGSFSDCRGQLHRYNKRLPRNAGGLIMGTTPELHAKVVEAIAPELDLIEALHREE